MTYTQDRWQKVVALIPSASEYEWTTVDSRDDVDQNTGNAVVTFEEQQTRLSLRFVRDRGLEHIDVGVRIIEEPPRFFSIQLVRAFAEGNFSNGQDLQTIVQSLKNKYDREIDVLVKAFSVGKSEVGLSPMDSLGFQLKDLQKVAAYFDLPIGLANFLRNEQNSLDQIESDLGHLVMDRLNEISGDRPRPHNTHTLEP